MKKYIIVYKNTEIENEDLYIKLKDKEFNTYKQALNYIKNNPQKEKELEIMLVEVL